MNEQTLTALNVLLTALNIPPDARRDHKFAATATACLAAYRRVAAELRLPPDQTRDTVSAFFTEFERRLPSFVTVVALATLLPVLGDRARGKARAAGESPENAEDIGQSVAVRILDAVFGRWPRGNVGAWVGTLCSHALSDRHRGRARDERGTARVRERCRAVGVGV